MRCRARLFRLSIALALLAFGSPARSADDATAPATLGELVQPFLAENCYRCHSAEKKSGKLDLQALKSEGPIEKQLAVWDKVFKRLKSGEMPPEDEQRPDEAKLKAVLAWLEKDVARAHAATASNPGRVTARRLNRTEYNNSVRDLLGVDFRPAEDFPPDDSGYGFDNNGDVLTMSPVLMEKYLRAAEKVARTALFGVEPLKPSRAVHQPWFVAFDKRPQVKFEYDESGLSLPSALHMMHRFPVEGDYDLEGLLRGDRPDGSEPIRMGYWIDGQLIKEMPAEVPRGGEVSGVKTHFRTHVTAGEHWLAVSMLNIYEGLPAGFNGPNPSKRAGGRAGGGTIGFFCSNLDITGPYDQVKGPVAASLEKIYTCRHRDGQHDAECAKKIVTDLARRAYRRPVTDEEIRGLVGLVELAQKEGDSFEEGLCLAIQKILISPHFLFRVEREPSSAAQTSASTAATYPINDHELATRLSYFLWSSLPDAELNRCADEKTLHTPDVLSAQVKRMLADPKTHALVENFFGQWLQFRALESHKPDQQKFQEYSDYTRLSMQKETELFCAHLIREDRSILDLIDAKYTFLNQRLAEYYGIAEVAGHEFRKVELTDSPRGGVLTQGTVLTVSSYAHRTSPVLRGKWILENILNAAPPPPPPDVPSLDETTVNASLPLRVQMEKHRTNATCASCHVRMDPLGLGLENFDAVGRWRTMDGRAKIDASGTLPDGRSFNGPAELKTILLAEKTAFAECMAEKMLTFALGRGIEPFDRKTVQAVAADAAASDYRFSSLVLGIVQSPAFQQRMISTASGEKP